MNHAQVKALLISAVDIVSSSIVDYAVNPGKDFYPKQETARG